MGAIDDLTSRLNSEQSQMSSFHNAMERMTDALARTAEQDQVTAELLLKVVAVVGEVGRSRVASGNRTLAGVARKKDEVSALRDELLKVRRLANTDALTSLSNRRHFDETLATHFQRPTPFALLLADIDHFKRLNDAYGHAFGDHVLKAVALTIKAALREGSFLARTGGEEFAILLAGQDERNAMAVAERVRAAIEKLRVKHESDNIALTLSIGIALSTHAQNPDHLYEAADAALYRSKNTNRNTCTLFDPSGDEVTSTRYQLYAG